MASPQDVRRRTEQYRLEQEALGELVSNQVAREVTSWMDVRDPYRGFWAFIDRLIALVREGRLTSHTLAQAYYGDLRNMEGIEGEPPEIEEDDFPINPLIASMVYVGPEYAKSLVQRDQTEGASEVVGAAMGRAAMKHTLDAGRTAVFSAVRSDDRAIGWKRITDSDPCDWCLMLAGRGAVYKSAKTAGLLNKWHDGCACSVVPVFRK